MKLHWCQHVPFEGLGSIEKWANRSGHLLTSTQFYSGDRLPSVDAFDCLVIMGGPMNIYEEDKFPWLSDEKRFVRDAICSGKSVLGICLGAQLVADVLGAAIYPNTYREIGWFPVKRTADTEYDRFLPEEVEAFHWHGDTFDSPPGSIHLARSEACEN